MGLRRPAAVALGPSGGALYVSFLKNGNILRINRPAGLSQTGRIIGKSSNGLRVVSLAFVGSDLYLAETVAVTKMVAAPSCTGLCTSAPTTVHVTAPVALAYNGTHLYAADIASVTRYTVLTGTQGIWANGGLANGVSVAFQNVTALGVDAAGNVYVGDDPSDGLLLFEGRVWKVTPTP